MVLNFSVAATNALAITEQAFHIGLQQITPLSSWNVGHKPRVGLREKPLDPVQEKVNFGPGTQKDAAQHEAGAAPGMCLAIRQRQCWAQPWHDSSCQSIRKIQLIILICNYSAPPSI